MPISDDTAQLTTELNGASRFVRDIIGRETRSGTGEDSELGSGLITLRQFTACYIFWKRQMPVKASTNLTATVIMKPLLVLVELLR